jgi:hypothetical protein
MKAAVDFDSVAIPVGELAKEGGREGSYRRLDGGSDERVGTERARV